MRPNYAMDPPPAALSVGGASYPIDVDYRTWIEVGEQLKQLVPGADDPEQRWRNAEVFAEIQARVFGGVLEEDPGETLGAILEFLRGYPSAPIEPDDGPPVYSFAYDLNEIILAIRNQSGIDLSYRRREPFHWWEFLLEMRTLCGDHYILRLMEARGYAGTDKEMLRLKRRCALPVEHSAAEQALLDDINAEFYNA